MSHPSRIRFPSRLTLIALACSASMAHAQTTPIQDQLLQRVESLTQELERLKAELKQVQVTQQQTQAMAQPTATAPTAPATVLSSYGEINYSRPKDHSQAKADVRRFVIGLQHRFDEKTKLVSELEVEHSIASADDQGEVEVEQLYIEHQLNDTYGVRGGLILMPIGLLNTNHEPTAYYGVERNFIETAIIPSTWREGGVQVFGEHDNGISWSAGMSTGFDISAWDASSSETRESPLGSIHQELQLAKAHDPPALGNVDWRGSPGLRVGASAFSGGASQSSSATAKPHITVWDAHVKWTPGRWDLTALYARGSISQTSTLNQASVGSPYLIPKAFDGSYVQAAYRWQIGHGYTLAPFARYERYNTARSFEGVSAALNLDQPGTEAVTTVGANFYLNPNVVLKADLQRFKLNSGNNRLNLGIGYTF